MTVLPFYRNLLFWSSLGEGEVFSRGGRLVGSSRCLEQTCGRMFRNPGKFYYNMVTYSNDFEVWNSWIGYVGRRIDLNWAFFFCAHFPLFFRHYFLIFLFAFLSIAMPA